jgi:hypothetical protein
MLLLENTNARVFAKASRRRAAGIPGFPAEVGQIDELHAAFLIESRTRGRGWFSVQEIRGIPRTAKGLLDQC